MTTKTTIFLAIAFFLCACSKEPQALTNHQIIEMTEECQSAGLKAVAMHGNHQSSGSAMFGDETITEIRCEPKL